MPREISTMTEPSLCACGCGNRITILPHHKWRGIPKFVSGHNLGVNNPTKGKRLSKDTRMKMSLNSPRIWLGKNFLEGHRIKLSEAHKGKKLSEEHKNRMRGKTPWNKNRHNVYSEGVLKKMREKAKERYKDPRNHPQYGKHPTEETRRKLVEKRRHRVMPKEDTIPEKMLQQELTLKGIHFETHKPVAGQPDIFIDPNICVFVDGCWWHGCEKCNDKNKFTTYIKSNSLRDSEINKELANNGYIVIRLWEHQIKKDMPICIDEVTKALIPKPAACRQEAPRTLACGAMP